VVVGNNGALNGRFNRENYINHSATTESSAGSYVVPLPEKNTCYLLGFTFDRVAEGKIISKDPRKEVDGQPLGDEYYEVYVAKVLSREDDDGCLQSYEDRAKKVSFS
ncbi:hypothetical protein Taro_018298, partial [Colocasia esculenta]|nr:hypothetical protein [Colocasia esculenta]